MFQSPEHTYIRCRARGLHLNNVLLALTGRQSQGRTDRRDSQTCLWSARTLTTNPGTGQWQLRPDVKSAQTMSIQTELDAGITPGIRHVAI